MKTKIYPGHPHEFIVKLQISFATTEAKPQALVYDEARSFEFQCDATPEMEALMAGRLKAYFWCRLSADAQLGFVREAEAQPW